MEAIAAMALNRIIGKDGGIPWKCSADMKWFKEFTMGKKLVMGRKTFEKMPVLKGRKVILLSNSWPFNPVTNIENPWPDTVINDLNYIPNDAVVAGGAKVYEELLPYCSKFYLTLIKQNVEGDTVMPLFEHLFSKVEVLKDTDEYALFLYSK